MTVIPAARIAVKTEDATLDLVAFGHALSALGDRRRAGKLRGYVEAIYEANPGLATAGLILPRGTIVVLPEFVVEDGALPVARLWDEPA